MARCDASTDEAGRDDEREGAAGMALTARGVIARTPGAAAAVEEFVIDDPGPDEVLVRILASGVCHTDLGVKSGTYGSEGFPFLLGHEGCGIIEATGPGVDNVKA